MRNTRVAKRYAKALMDMAVETNQVDAIKNDVDLLRVATTGELDYVLKSPIIRQDKKQAIFTAIFGGKVSQLTELFFKLLFEKGREIGLPEILDAFDTIYRKMKNIEILELTTAIPVSEEVKAGIVSNFNKMPEYASKTLEIKEKLDESILGGFLAQIGDQLYDASIRHDLQAIKKQFVENMYIQKLR
ncbi:ATP synthase F1 subunit delta [Flavihumibacter sp. UBA7668]|uniref:ATP synthase F1 subunit delta n=1 Tax=Flavihumibacter sp. UBA7668 TaxID=1946542 RepID=UPI0025BCE3DE|nr:ATP synthase F1 subunit delta [Flavihumibacter sp. UBA7668]